MKLKTGTLLVMLLWCWFIGAVAISVGVGSFFPSINLVSKPLICPHGKMEPQRHVYRPYPGTTIINVTWSCTDESSGVKTELGDSLVVLFSGAFYGVLLFVVALIAWPSLTKGVQTEPQAGMASTPENLQSSGDSVERMQELNELRAGNLISEREYEEKRSEILKNI